MANHPNRGPRHGHLPGHIRNTFGEAIDAFVAADPDALLPLVPYDIDYRERLISLAEACRLVRNCTDVLPGIAFRELQDGGVEPAKQTYAAAAQALLRELQAAGRVDAKADIARRRLYDARDTACRDLENRIFSESLSNRAMDEIEARIRRARASAIAEEAVATWREAPGGAWAHLERLITAVIAAEDAVAAKLAAEGITEAMKDAAG